MALRELTLHEYSVGGKIVSACALKSVLRCIADHGDTCWASSETIARETCLSERTARRAVRALSELHLIDMDPRPGATASCRVRWDTIFGRQQRSLGGLQAALTPDPVTDPTPEPSSDPQVATPELWDSNPGTMGHPPRNYGTVTPEPSSDETIETNRNRKKQERGRARKFVPPSLDDVQSYWNEAKLNGNPEDFLDHYTANGWRRSNGLQVSDWNATARRWSAREHTFESKDNQQAKPKFNQYGKELI
jgi:hypothetical protein